MQLTDRGVVALTHAILCIYLRRAQIVFAMILEPILFHPAPSPLSILGTVIIVGSALYVAVRFSFAALVDDD